MKIEKFNLIDNGKVIYAVSGVSDNKTAMDAVRKYKKENGDNFYKTHSSIAGSIYKNKLYVGDISYTKKKPCIIVARNDYHMEKWSN
jgi:hypothetical protein